MGVVGPGRPVLTASTEANNAAYAAVESAEMSADALAAAQRDEGVATSASGPMPVRTMLNPQVADRLSSQRNLHVDVFTPWDTRLTYSGSKARPAGKKTKGRAVALKKTNRRSRRQGQRNPRKNKAVGALMRSNQGRHH